MLKTSTVGLTSLEPIKRVEEERWRRRGEGLERRRRKGGEERSGGGEEEEGEEMRGIATVKEVLRPFHFFIHSFTHTLLSALISASSCNHMDEAHKPVAEKH